MINIPVSELTSDLLLRVGNQYKWFSSDNNWISVQPNGGDMEIEKIQISKGI